MQVESVSYRKIAIVLAVLASLAILWYFSTIVIYIVVSLFLSLLGRPIQHTLKKVRIRNKALNSSLIATITLVLLFLVIGGFIYLTAPVLIGQLVNISSSAGVRAGDILQFPLKDFQDAINENIPGAKISFKDIIREELEPIFSIDLLKNTVSYIAKTTVDILVGIFCISFITFFFLQDERMFSRWIMSLIPDEYEANMEHVMDSIYILQIRYMVGITIESIIKFLLLWLSFWLFGLYWDTALVASVLCALLNVIPYVGPIIGGAIAMLLGLVAAPEGLSIYQLEVSMLIALLVFQIIDNILLQPYIYASSVKAHPLEIFIVILMAGYIGGIVGMLVAIPTYTIVRVLAKEFLSRFKVVRELTTKL